MKRRDGEIVELFVPSPLERPTLVLSPVDRPAFLALPPELLLNILSFLAPVDVLMLALVSKGLRRIVDEPSLWMALAANAEDVLDEQLRLTATSPSIYTQYRERINIITSLRTLWVRFRRITGIVMNPPASGSSSSCIVALCRLCLSFRFVLSFPKISPLY